MSDTKDAFTVTEVHSIQANFFDRSAAHLAFETGDICEHTVRQQGMPLLVYPKPGMHRKWDKDKESWEIVVMCPLCEKRYSNVERELAIFINQIEQSDATN